jgi:transposase
MNGHRNAKLGLAGRHALVLAIEDGMTLKAAAAAFNVAPATAHRWWHRWLEAAPVERGTLACLSERSSRPHRSPRMLSADQQERICEVRQHTGWGPRLIAGVIGHPHSTVHKVLRRHRCSRIPKPPRGQVCRYEWDCPGDLLHMDTKRFARFERPGHAVTGVRDKTSAEKRHGVAMSSRTRSSTTTPAWPIRSCTRTSEPRRSRASSGGRLASSRPTASPSSA